MALLLLELLWSQKGVEEVDDQSDRDDAEDEVGGVHLHLQARSHTSVPDGEEEERDYHGDVSDITHPHAPSAVGLVLAEHTTA
jgi:hypothetical protein